MFKVNVDINSIAGYSAASRDLLRSWYGKIDYWIYPVTWGDSKFEMTGWWADHIDELITPKLYDTLLCVGLPERHYVVEEGIKNIALTYFEVSRIGKEWVDKMNLMDEIWTGAQFSKDVFINCGVKVPIKVVKWPVIEEDYVDITPINFSDFQNNAFTFFHQGTFDSRKNITDLIVSYCMEFQKEAIDNNGHIPDDATLLVIKTYLDWEDKVKRVVDDTIINIKNSLHLDRTPMVAVVQDKVSDKLLLQQIASIDALAYTSHGEGVGGPLLPCSKFGKPIIAAPWSSIPEYCSIDYPVEYTLEPVNGMNHIESYRCNPMWARLNLTSLRKQMRSCYNDNRCY